jgi:hypothetical protein
MTVNGARLVHLRRSKLRDADCSDVDATVGGWPRERLVKMDTAFAIAMREALAARPDPGRPARVIRHPARGPRR